MKLLKAVWLACLLACSATVGAKEYSILPVIDSDRTSSDGRTWMIDVIDTEYKRGTFVIDLETGRFDWAIGSNAGTGYLQLEEGAIDLPGIRNMSDVVAWNLERHGGGDGGVHLVMGRNGREANYEAQWAWLFRIFRRGFNYCRSAHTASLAVLTAAASACRAQGGVYSGGSAGVCGVGSTLGECHRQSVK